MLSATFYGVRGSTPCSGESTNGYGGNTSCVLVEVPGQDPIICDLGTGLRYLGRDLEQSPRRRPFSGTALISHLHWDHIQGLPFFRPVLGPGAHLELIGPRQEFGRSLASAFERFVCPPVFPVSLANLPGSFSYRDACDEVLQVGRATVTCFTVPHVGPTNGYRIDAGHGSVAYLSDHQQPLDGSHDVPEDIVEACRGVDILIHDAQFDADEFAERADWGHCTPDFALELARRCGARRLVLFHHDPAHDDDWIRSTVERVQAAAGEELVVIGAAEGMRLVSGCP